MSFRPTPIRAVWYCDNQPIELNFDVNDITELDRMEIGPKFWNHKSDGVGEFNNFSSHNLSFNSHAEYSTMTGLTNLVNSVYHVAKSRHAWYSLVCHMVNLLRIPDMSYNDFLRSPER